MTDSKTTDDNEAKADFNQRDLRDALSKFATGVTIVTTTDHETSAPIGMTVSSFNSVSMDPPLILWSLTKSSLSASAFQKAKHFAVHVLGSHQVELSNRFASRGEDKFGGLDYRLNKHGTPILPDTLSCMQCSTWDIYEGGDHWIIVGKVEEISTNQGEGLVFNNGSYSTATTLNLPEGKEPLLETSIDNLLLYNISRAYRQMSNQFYDSVHGSGLTLAEWRILASLSGGATRNITDLSARTFIDPVALLDKVHTMQEAGLCHYDDTSKQVIVSGTEQGQERVADLLALGAKQETVALQGSEPEESDILLKQLKLIIKNTDH